jgi:aryl-alcohol dehydrogenase-like predicted oxidoreductase
VKLALGTVQFGLNYGIANQSGQVSLPMVAQIISLAREHHIDVIDTAAAYGDSEVTLGRVGVQGFRIVTKLSPLPETLNDVGVWARRQLTESLERLRVQSIHGLLLHRASDLLGPQGRQLFRVLEDLRASGQVSKIGVSIYSPAELDHVLQLGRIDLVQVPFNLIDRRLQTSGWLKRLKDGQVEIHVRSAFLQGLLLTPVDRIPAKFSPWSTIWQSWAGWQERTGCSALGACLAFPHSCAEVDRIVVGVDSPDHLTQILGALDAGVPRDWPDIACDDERLVHPSRWSEL